MSVLPEQSAPSMGKKFSNIQTFKCSAREKDMINKLSTACGETPSECLRSSPKFKLLFMKMMQNPDVLLRFFELFEDKKDPIKELNQ